MRNRKWLYILIVGAFIVFIVFALGNRSTAPVQAAVDTRTMMERYVDAYTKYTNAMLDRFDAYRAALDKADWDAFWSMLVRMVLSTAVILGGYFGFRVSPVIVDRFRVVKTDRGHVWIGRDGNGEFVSRLLDVPFQQPAEEKKPASSYTIVKGEQMIEVDKSGKVVDVVDDPIEFLEKAIQVNGPRSKELPSHEKMNVSGERWSKIVNDLLGGVFDVKPGRTTLCAQFPDLQTTYYAVKRGEVTPLPTKKKTPKK